MRCLALEALWSAPEVGLLENILTFPAQGKVIRDGGCRSPIVGKQGLAWRCCPQYLRCWSVGRMYCGKVRVDVEVLSMVPLVLECGENVPQPRCKRNLER